MNKTYVKRIALWLLDVACVSLSYIVASVLRFDGPLAGNILTYNRAVYAAMILITFLINFVAHDNRGFMKRGGFREFGRALRYNIFLGLGAAVASYVFHIQPSRLFVVSICIIDTVVMTVVRWLAKWAARRVFKGERSASPIVMIIEKGQRETVSQRFTPGFTYAIAGWLELDKDGLQGTVKGHPIRCSLAGVGEALKSAGAREIPDFFICTPHASERDLIQLVDAVEQYGTNCHVAIEMPDPNLQGAQLGYFGELPVVTYTGRGSVFYRRYVKRLIDIVASLLVVIVAFIPGAILAIIIVAQSGGAPFYSQERLGKNGKHFKLYKFRSMVSDADNVEKYFTPEQLETWHRERKVDNDPRITGIGRFLRKTSLDEFPQFINVLKGDMSVVGPRPIVDEEIVHYGNRESEFLSVRPGITGWWQVVARNSATYVDGSRQELELYYVRHTSFTLDWNIIKRTFGAVFNGTGQ